MSGSRRRPLQELVTEMLGAMSLPEGIHVENVKSWDVRLLCPPRGHFCLNVAVIEFRDGIVVLHPLDKNQERLDAEYVSDLLESRMSRPPRGATGWLRQSKRRIGVFSRAEVAVDCANGKCSYSGTFEYFGLADEVRAAVASGHAEYRLIN